MDDKDMKMDEDVLSEDNALSCEPSLAVTEENEDAVVDEAGEAFVSDDGTSVQVVSEYCEENATFDTEPSEEKKEDKKQESVLSYLHDLVFGLVAILLVFMLLFRGVVVSGPSMQNTLVDGDYVILLSNTFYQNPKQGDIIVASKESFKDGEPIIKRVIATEGQKVDIDFEAGIVYVDDVALDEPYTKTLTNFIYETLSFPLVVDEGCVFVMGDNRNDSLDSRSPSIGLIDCREIVGKAIFLVLPGTDNGRVERDYSRIGVLW